MKVRPEPTREESLLGSCAPLRGTATGLLINYAPKPCYGRTLQLIYPGRLVTKKTKFYQIGSALFCPIKTDSFATFNCKPLFLDSDNFLGLCRILSQQQNPGPCATKLFTVANNTILKQIASDKSSLLPKIQNTQNMTMILKCKLFTKVIKSQAKRLGLDRQ